MRKSLCLLMIGVGFLASHWGQAQSATAAVRTFDSLVRDYNLIAFGNASFNQHESEGKLAVQGNLSLNSFTVAAISSTVSTNDPALYVGGQLTLNNDSHLNTGSAYLPSTTGTYSGSTFYPSTGGKLIINSGAGNPAGASAPSNWNWSSIQSQAVSASQAIAMATPTGSIAVNGQTLTFSSTSGTAGVVVFNLDMSLLSGASYNAQYFSSISFALGANQTGVINVTNYDGKTLFGDGAINFNGSTSLASQLLWNFSGSGSVSLGKSGGDFFGSVLAPSVNVSNNSSRIDGQVIANSVTYSGAELHYAAFTPVGLDSGSVLVPEPSTYALWGAALCLGGLIWRRWRTMRKAALVPVCAR